MHVGMPFAFGHAVAMRGIVAARLLPPRRMPLPGGGILQSQRLQQRFCLIVIRLRQPRPPHRRWQQRQHGADVGPKRHGVMAPAGFHVHHVRAVMHAQRRRAARRVGQPRHQRARQLPQLDAGQQGIAQRQQRRAQAVAAQAGVIAQQAALDQRIGQPRNRGFGQAGAVGQFAIAERGLAMAKGLQHRQAVSQRGGEIRVGVAAAQGRGHGRNPGGDSALNSDRRNVKGKK
ncbi:hypothetical protein D3C73_679690 [compost metagenome]